LPPPRRRDAEVLDWQTLAPEMVTLVRITDLAGTLVLVLVFIAAAAGVANTMVMATFERTREFGMLLALGTHPARLMRLVVAESIALGLIGAVIGTSIGIVLVVVTHRTGIDYSWLAGGGPSELSFAGLRWSLRFYPTLSVVDGRDRRRLRHLPPRGDMAALRASRLQPVQALRGLMAPPDLRVSQSPAQRPSDRASVVGSAWCALALLMESLNRGRDELRPAAYARRACPIAPADAYVDPRLRLASGG
jgi:hypothetical protein